MESAKTEENSHHTWGVRIFAHLRGVCEFRTPFAQLRGRANFAHHSHTIRTPGAVVFQRPYLPRFSSKSYTVWSVRFLTSWALKWYIECKKWTSVSAPKVQKKTTAAVLFAFFTLFSASPLFFPCILWTTLAKGYGAPKLESSWIWASKSFAITCPSSSSIIWHAWIDS